MPKALGHQKINRFFTLFQCQLLPIFTFKTAKNAARQSQPAHVEAKEKSYFAF